MSKARFTRLVRDREQIGVEIEYTREGGAVTRFLFYDERSLRGHIKDLEKDGRDSSEENAALGALIVAGR